MNPILILKRDNVAVIVFDWSYDLIPTSVYYNRSALKIESYDFDYATSDGKIAYYKYCYENDK